MGIGSAARSLREAARRFGRHKSIFGVAVLTLALGISLCTTMFCVLYGVILRPLSYGDKQRLLVAWAGYEGGATERDTFDGQALAEWRQAAHTIDGLAAFRYTQFTLLQRGDPTDLEASYVSPELFSVLGAKAQVGGVFSPQLAKAERGKVVVLSHWLWRQRFNSDPAVAGKGVDLGGTIYTITGVMPEDFDVPSAEVALWAPLPDAANQASVRNLMLIGRLRPSTPMAAAQAESNGIAKRLAAEHHDTDAGMRIHLVPFFDELVKDSRPFVLAASGAAVLVLLICCANLSNLLLVRAIVRRSEFATRLAIGAQRRHLLGSVLAEGLLLAICGGLLGGWLARFMIETLLRLSPIELPRGASIGHGWQIPIVAAGLIIIAAILISLPPAWEVARSKLSLDTARGTRATTSRRFARQLIVTLELAIALTLLAGAGLMARTMLALRDANPGWKTDHVLASEIFLPPRNYKDVPKIQHFFETFVERLRATPGVVSVAASSAVPADKMGIDFDVTIQMPGKAADSEGRASIRSVTPGLFKTLGIPLLQGRDFDDGDIAKGVQRIIVNHAFGKRYLAAAPSVVGKQVIVTVAAPQTYEIIGEVGDVYHYGLLKEPKPEVYLPFAKQPFSAMGVVVRTTGDPLAFAPTFRKQLWSLDPELPVASVNSMDDMVKDTWSDRTFLTILMVFFALVAVALTIIGVFSVVSFSVSRQVREIGIRMAMGARSDDVVRLVMGQSARAVAAGVVLGLIGAWMLGRAIASQMYGVSAGDPWVLVGGAVFVGIVAGLGAYLPSRWATRIDPTSALRVE